MNQSFFHFKKNLASMLAIAIALQACGGGKSSEGSKSDDNDNANYNPSSTQYLGNISGLGSVVVNGIRFETLSSSLQDSDDLYGQSTQLKNLAIGMTVAIDGEADDSQRVGRARKIRRVGGVRGVVSQVNVSQLVIGGQTIQFDGNSVIYSNTALNTVSVGDFVNIDGLLQADNSFLARRIEITNDSQFTLDAAWRGQSSDVSSDGTQFSMSTGPNQTFSVQCPVNTCRIEPAGATLTGTHSVRVLAESDASRNGTTIQATRVQILDASRLLNWGNTNQGMVKIQGAATRSGSQWLINTTPVVGNGLNWTEGVFYEVKGTLTDGQLTVSSWEQEGQLSHPTAEGKPQTYRQELYGAISNLQGATMLVQGVKVNVGQAYFESGSQNTLKEGMYVEIKGNIQNGVLNATKVTTQGSNSNSVYSGSTFEIAGVMGNWNGSSFSLTTANATYQATLNPQSLIDLEHGTPSNGRYVQVKGYMSGSDLVVKKLEVEN